MAVDYQEVDKLFPNFRLKTDYSQADTPFYDSLPPEWVNPLDLDANLAYRRRVLELCYANPEYAREAWIMCKRDILFFINTFCWIYEPRALHSKVLPFVTYPCYQNTALKTMSFYAGRKDMLLEKSREQGATWMVEALVDWLSRFHNKTTMGLMSRVQDSVDTPGDPDTLMWKLDFLFRNTPAFLRYNRGRNSLNIRNNDRDCTVSGYSSTACTGVGGRKFMFVCDEYAKLKPQDSFDILGVLQHVTRCRLWLSTPEGAFGGFYKMRQQADEHPETIVMITLHWSRHPLKSRGLYTAIGGKLHVLDSGYVYPVGFDFILDGKLRSPWYDNECKRSPMPWLIARELDIDYAGSQTQFFDQHMLNRCLGAVSPRRHYATLDYDDCMEKVSLLPTIQKTDLELWCPLDNANSPPQFRRYSVGCDVAAGTGGDESSNSTIVVIDKTTGEQVAAAAFFGVLPYRFATYAVALARVFNNAMLNWEVNGPGGSQFTDAVMKTGYQNYYCRDVEMIDLRKKTRKPGWSSNEHTKPMALGNLATAMGQLKFIPNDPKLIAECRQYIYKNGQPVHSAALGSEDESSQGKAHGDRVIAAAMALLASDDIPQASVVEERKEAPYGSFGWRVKQRELESTARWRALQW